MSSYDRRLQPSGHLFVGGMLIVIGFLFLLQTLGFVQRGVISNGWPLILIAVGVVRIVRAESNESRIVGSMWIVIGSVFLLSRLGFLPFNVWSLFWPMMLMSFGAFLIVRSRFGTSVPNDSADRIHAMAFMGGVDRKITSNQFEGGELTAMMGGVKLDLREAVMAGDEAVLDVFVWAGGIELIIPDAWTLLPRVSPVMAGLEDKTRSAKDATKRLVIRGTLLMGGIEVKN